MTDPVRWNLLTPLAVVLLGGCAAPEYELAPVSGIVTLDGEPLADAVVSFQPQSTGSENIGPGSTDRCDADGRFRLKTIHDEDGAVVATHRVRIYSHSAESPATSDVDEEQPVERVPEIYNYRSQLEFEVVASGTDKADFQLRSEP